MKTPHKASQAQAPGRGAPSLGRETERFTTYEGDLVLWNHCVGAPFRVAPEKKAPEITSSQGPFFSLKGFERVRTEKDSKLTRPLVATKLQYPLLGYAGALSVPWLEESVSLRLELADKWVVENSEGRARILLWDALRTRECQWNIWRNYETELRCQNPGVDQEELARMVALFVSNPEGVFRHGTGGAVDVTLMCDGIESHMGTSFDEFSPRSASHYFHKFPPITDADCLAHSNRELLRNAMEFAGFIVLAEEWWHFEFGTAMWSEHTEMSPFLEEVLLPPDWIAFPAQVSLLPKAMPCLVSGVAQAFASNQLRKAALAGAVPAHYYARSSNQTRTDLEANFIRQ